MKTSISLPHAVIFGVVFALFSVVTTYLSHGISHHFPTLSLVLWAALYPSVLVWRLLEESITYSIYWQFIVIFAVQFFVGSLLYVAVKYIFNIKADKK